MNSLEGLPTDGSVRLQNQAVPAIAKTHHRIIQKIQSQCAIHERGSSSALMRQAAAQKVKLAARVESLGIRLENALRLRHLPQGTVSQS